MHKASDLFSVFKKINCVGLGPEVNYISDLFYSNLNPFNVISDLFKILKRLDGVHSIAGVDHYELGIYYRTSRLSGRSDGVKVDGRQIDSLRYCRPHYVLFSI